MHKFIRGLYRAVGVYLRVMSARYQDILPCENRENNASPFKHTIFQQIFKFKRPERLRDMHKFIRGLYREVYVDLRVIPARYRDISPCEHRENNTLPLKYIVFQ